VSQPVSQPASAKANLLDKALFPQRFFLLFHVKAG
jgi:hypothetical protein